MKASSIVAAGIIVLTAVAVIIRLNLVKVPIGQTGVLTEEWGSGLVHEDFPPGFHRDFGPLHSWELYDTTVQTLAMITKDNAALSVKSADGANVSMDITIKYRIKPGECWALRKDLGTGDTYKLKVRNEVIDALRRVFGTMETKDFYDPQQRVVKARESEDVLGRRLDGLHVELVEILVRDIRFDPEYEKRIENKALQSQSVEVNKAQRTAAEFRGETQKVQAETEAKVTVIRQTLEKTRRELTADNTVKIAKIDADANKYVLETRADADLYQAQKAAEGDLLTKNADAEAERLRKVALHGTGATNLIALEAAKNLNLTRLVISTMDNNVLDLPKFAEKLGTSAAPAASPAGK